MENAMDTTIQDQVASVCKFSDREIERFCELIRSQKTTVQAIEVIEAEREQGKAPDPRLD